MAESVEKAYATALFELIEEEKGAKSNALSSVLDELNAISQALQSVPEFSKALGVPTISKEEKTEIIGRIFKGRLSEYTFNFLNVLAIAGRFGYFARIVREFRALYNDAFGIIDAVATSIAPLTEAQRSKIKEKIESVTHKTVRLTEKVDKSLIGGVVVDYGSTRLDGSVKTRLESLRQSIADAVV